jgi:hypothetical protein
MQPYQPLMSAVLQANRGPLVARYESDDGKTVLFVNEERTGLKATLTGVSDRPLRNIFHIPDDRQKANRVGQVLLFATSQNQKANEADADYAARKVLVYLEPNTGGQRVSVLVHGVFVRMAFKVRAAKVPEVKGKPAARPASLEADLAAQAEHAAQQEPVGAPEAEPDADAAEAADAEAHEAPIPA